MVVVRIVVAASLPPVLAPPLPPPGVRGGGWGWGLLSRWAPPCFVSRSPSPLFLRVGGWAGFGWGGCVWCWPISTSRLASASRRFHLWPIDPLFWRGPLTPRRGRGNLISERASRLDAFSGYPFRTWPTSRAPGGTTGTPEVRPSRSSRTGDGPPSSFLRAQRIGTELSHDVLNPARVPL